jgi:hypothetical protein
MVTAEIPYTVDTGEKLVNETFGPNNIRRRTTGSSERRAMSIEDGRTRGAELALDLNGFVLVDHPTHVNDFFDEAQLKTVYYPEVERLIESVSGASRVVLFDHTLADARSVDPEDLLVAERRYPNRVGQTYRLKYNPRHRWFYFPRMRRDEALVFKVYDSAKDGRARFTPHTSFQDVSTRPDAPPRQSIEARALAFF